MSTKRHVFDILSVLTLMMIFAFLALSVALTGTSVYSRINEATRENTFMRTSALYLQQKLRREDGSSKISLETMGGSDALVFTRDYDGEEYHTYIYHYDGYLMEVMSPAAVLPSPQSGQRLTELSSFSVTQDANMGTLLFSLGNPDGGTDTFIYSVRSGMDAR